MVEIGQSVTFTDSLGKPRPALVTCKFGGSETREPSINVVIVNDDAKQADTYGNKIERHTSVPHQKDQAAPGYSWHV